MSKLAKRPYLIQRVEFTAPEPKDDRAALRLKDIFNYDYMGSAEFEFGAIGKSIREIARCGIQTDSFLYKGRKYFVTYAHSEPCEEYVRSIADAMLLVEAKPYDLKEDPEWPYDKKNYTDVWFDIENNFIISIHNVSVLLPTAIENTDAFMESQCKK